MSENIEVVFFDLFFTLVTPKYNDIKNEHDVLGITKDQWEKYTEDDELYTRRATGEEKDPLKIIEAIIEKMEIEVEESGKREILKLREERFAKALTDVDPTILEVLSDLKKSGKKLCLVSNADIIDVAYWHKSPLSHLFDNVIFSYEVGCLKPQCKIYQVALERMNVKPENCVFVGDGGSDEMKGAKELGIKTILTAHLLRRDPEALNEIKKFADYYVEAFREIKDILGN